MKYALNHSGWRKLEGTAMDEFVSFYKKLRRDCILFYIPLMEFEALNITYEADGLCLPGLGLRLFEKCGRALLQVLE